MKLFAKKEKTKLEVEIDRVLDKLSTIDPVKHEYEYEVITDQLSRLHEAKSRDADNQVSMDTLAIIAGNLLGIGLILNYEKANIITTKALGFIIKGRV